MNSPRLFGDNGVVFVESGTPAPDGDYYGFTVIDPITVTSAEFVSSYSADAGILDALVFPVGNYFFRLKNLVVSAGKCFLYKN